MGDKGLITSELGAEQGEMSPAPAVLTKQGRVPAPRAQDVCRVQNVPLKICIS